MPEITDSEALTLLGLDPDLRYWQWIAGTDVIADAMDADPDDDGHRNLVEYARGMELDASHLRTGKQTADVHFLEGDRLGQPIAVQIDGPGLRAGAGQRQSWRPYSSLLGA